MAKKNEFIFNIGFNRENPDHVKVAGILNRLGHGKAEYLARAVLAYESGGRKQTGAQVGIDSYELEQMIRRILDEQRKQMDGVLEVEVRGNKKEVMALGSREETIDDSDMERILMALDGFKN